MVLEKTLESPWTARRSNQPILKEITPGCSWKDWCWSWNSNTLATWCKWLIWTDPNAGNLKAGGEGDDRGWDGWMASLTQWTWIWVNSRSWWWTGRPGMLWFMGSQRVGHDWATELNWNKGWLGNFVWRASSALSLRACTLSHFSRVWLFATLWTVARQAPVSKGFSRQGY